MRKSLFYLLFWLYFPAVLLASDNSECLKSYYTRLSYDDKGYTGKYADVLVKIPGKGELVFSREYGYCPYWQPVGGKMKLLDRIIKVPGLKSGRQQDHNISSNVAIVERSDSLAIVHWRYARNTTSKSFTDFISAYNAVGNPSSFYAEYVDEYFKVDVSGKVERIVKTGCYSWNEWNDPKNQFTQNLLLTKTGFKEIDFSRPRLSSDYSVRISHDVRKADFSRKPVLMFNFDDALECGSNTTVEGVSSVACSIQGVRPSWQKGVSGSCLSFDSYSSAVVLPARNVPRMDGNLSFSTWISPLEYPINTAAILDHISGYNGYFLGMNRQGEIVFQTGNGRQIKSMHSTPVHLYDWTHIVVNYDAKSSKASIYINGELNAENQLVALDDAENTNMTIGKTVHIRQFPMGAERDITKEFQSEMVFSGLIDELCVFNETCLPAEIKQTYDVQKPLASFRQRPYILPETPYKNQFEASYLKLKYYPGWDNLWRVGDYADLVVTFKHKPWRYVFWRGTRYLPSLVTDYGRSGIWSSDQGPESFLGLCYEHMSDKLCRFSNIRLIHSSPARIVVHWRNASVNIAYQWPKLNKDGWGIWTDEYWTIYPDGTSIRHQLLHNSEHVPIIEMNQNEILHHPGQTSEDLFMDDAVYLGNHKGEVKKYSRTGAADVELQHMNMLYTNLNASTKQFQIGEIGTRIEIELDKDIWWNGWNHYPAQLIPSDGTDTYLLYDRGGSSCVSTFREVRHVKDSITTEAMQIYGLTNERPEDMLKLNRYWNFSPQITEIQGGTSLGFVKSERAYYLHQDNSSISFHLQASVDSPVVNPVFVITDYKGSVSSFKLMINNKEIPCEKGIEIDDKGNEVLVVWMKYQSTQPVKINMFFQ